MLLFLVSDWVVRRIGQESSGLVATLDPRNLLKQGPVHPGLLRVHHSAQCVLLLILSVRATDHGARSVDWETTVHRSHLLAKELLIGKQLLFTGVLIDVLLTVVFLGSLYPPVHVRFVSPGLVLFAQALFSDLRAEGLVELLMLSTKPVLFVDIL